jgi:hypothetical protein
MQINLFSDLNNTELKNCYIAFKDYRMLNGKPVFNNKQLQKIYNAYVKSTNLPTDKAFDKLYLELLQLIAESFTQMVSFAEDVSAKI